MTSPLLEVHDLVVEFPAAHGQRLRAVDGVSLSIEAGDMLGLVGESGCGKSTLARTIVGLESAKSGYIRHDGVDLRELPARQARRRRRDVQLIFQDPEASLSPRLTVGQTLEEPLRLGGVSDRRERLRRVSSLLDLVGLPDNYSARMPQALSGGQRQRVGIARALASEPKLLVCDEPVSALDVSVRAQVMNVLLDLRRELGLGCIFIAHDLALVRQACEQIAVMYLGQIVEEGSSRAICAAPQHPYTQALLAAAPSPDPEVERRRERIVLMGDPPSPITPPTGCRFHPRCVRADRQCSVEVPHLHEVSRSRVACYHPGPVVQTL